MTTQSLRSIYQIKVTLKGAKPPIWRRFQMASSDTLEELHLVLQIVMGWANEHMHEFTHQQQRYGVPDQDYPSDIIEESNHTISHLLKNEKDKLSYTYDFGDGWQHDVVLEKILPFEHDAILPHCIKGKRACPPEDIGGLGGYENTLQILSNPSAPEYEETLEWLGGEFDPEYFNLTDINLILNDCFNNEDEPIEVDLTDISNPNTIDYLDHFLLYRIKEELDNNDYDEGILCISELDGFFTAIVSGPELIPPSQWLPAVWGDFEPEWESEEEFQNIVGLMINIMNSIATTLMEAPEEFEADFEYREVDEQVYLIVDEWCEGYWQGISLAADSWHIESTDMSILLSPILAFSSQLGWKGHEFNEQESDNLKRAIIPNVRDIHAYWLARRASSNASIKPDHRNAPKTGRNDPCPCGSGKKYKKCCLH